MKNPMSMGGTKKPAKVLGLEAVPPGAHVVPMEVKKQFESNPVHVFHPTPYTAVTVLRNRKNPHDWLACGWYLDTFREHGAVKGLVYKQVTSEEDKQHVIAELKKLDKDAVVRFSV